MAGNTSSSMPTGLVVMPLKEYNDLLAQIGIANQEASDALSRSAKHTMEANVKLSDTLNNLCMVERQVWGRHNITVHFNEKAMFDLAMQKLVKTFSEEELAAYTLLSSEDFVIGDVTLGRRKPDDADLAPGAETL